MRTIGSGVSRRGSTTSAAVIISVVDAGISSIPDVARNARIGDASPGWTHDPPRSTGTPASVTVWVRPPIRSRPSSTVTGTPSALQRPRRDQTRYSGADDDDRFDRALRPSRDRLLQIVDEHGGNLGREDA